MTLPAILIAAAVFDYRFRKIPNLVTYPAMVVGILYNGLSRGGDGFLFGLGGLFLGLGLLIIPYLMGGMGAGDVKLLAAVGAFTGPWGVFYSFLYTALAGGIYALALMFFGSGGLKAFAARQYQSLVFFALTRQAAAGAPDPQAKRPRLCYGIPIAVGTIFYLGPGLFK